MPPKQETYRRGRGPYHAQVPWELQDDPRADPGIIATYAALQRFTDFGGETGARVSDRQAADKAHLSTKAFRAKRMKLREMGWISWDTVDDRNDAGQVKGRINAYVVHRSLERLAPPHAEPESVPIGNQSPHPYGTESGGGADNGVRRYKELPRANLPKTNGGSPAPDVSRETPPGPTFRSDVFVEVWTAAYGAESTMPGQFFKVLQALAAKHGHAKTIGAFGRFVENTPAQFVSAAMPRKFEATFGTWLRGNGAGKGKQRPTQDLAGKNYRTGTDL